MIQRIQTVFLLIAFILVGLLFFIPFASIMSTDIFNLSILGVSSVNPKLNAGLEQPFWLTGLGTISALLILIDIFLYKKRKLQINLCFVSLVLLIALNLSMYTVTQDFHTLFSAEISYKIAFVFPLVAAVLVFLAYRSIKKDDNLVRSLDRIR
jgi:tellurite resistance protein TehA-like permease